MNPFTYRPAVEVVGPVLAAQAIVCLGICAGIIAVLTGVWP